MNQKDANQDMTDKVSEKMMPRNDP